MIRNSCEIDDYSLVLVRVDKNSDPFEDGREATAETRRGLKNNEVTEMDVKSKSA